jgi:hypothetical protein
MERVINFSVFLKTSSSGWSEVTALWTQQIGCAFSALTVSQRKINSYAAESPTSLDSRCVPPLPGMMPRVISRKPITALSEAILKSHQKASSRAAPSA